MHRPAPPAATISLASALAETRRLHDWLEAALGAAGVAPRTAHAVQLCLEEAVMNVVLHGYGPGAPGRIRVRLRMAAHRVAALVEDAAAPFDPLGVPPPRAAGAAGGRGLGLLRAFSSAARYRRRAGRNLLWLCFDRAVAA